MSLRAAIALILLVAAGGLAIRLPRLAERPMHCDEAVHAEKFKELWIDGRYVYDPHEYHGPTHYYAALPIVWLSGTNDYDHLSEATLRLTPVLFGVLLIALTALVADGLGRGAEVWAALLTAVSPAFVYYSRYYIQEMLLICFTFGLIACGWRFVQSRRTAWALAAGAFFGLMHATKETCLIAWGCLGGALIVEYVLGRGAIRSLDDAAASRWQRLTIPVLAGFGVAAAVSICFFTAFFSNLRGPLDSILTYATYFERAGNHGLHNHPPGFYWERLLNWHYRPAPRFSEWFILAGSIVGFVAIAWRRPGADGSQGFRRFVLVYTASMTLIYTAIPYKTPWCMLGFFHGMILVAGIGFDALVGAARMAAPRMSAAAAAVAGLFLLIGVWDLLQQSQRAISRKFAADHRNPYVYSHTINNLLDLGTWIERVAAVYPAGKYMPVQVIATEDDYWPLPWYLRRLKHVSFRKGLDEGGELPDAAIVVVSTDLEEAFEKRRRDVYPVKVFYGLRPRVQLVAYAREDAWNVFRASQPSASGPASDLGGE